MGNGNNGGTKPQDEKDAQQAREAELEEKAKALAAKEAELKAKEEAIKAEQAALSAKSQPQPTGAGKASARWKVKCDCFAQGVLYHEGETVEGGDFSANPNFARLG